MTRRMMARPVSAERSRPRMMVSAIATLVVVALAAIAIPAILAGAPPPGTGASSPPLVAAPPTAQRSPETTPGSAGSGSGAGSGGGVRPGRPRQSARPAPLPSTQPQATPTAAPELPSTDAPGTLAPDKPTEFDLRRQQVDIGFPLRPETRYVYRNNFLDPRDGAPESYNHGRLDSDGALLRLHDGIDIYADLGEPLVAPFSGTVIDPATRWEPWIADRYGRTVVIVSDDPRTDGYIALLSHLDRVWVEVGQHVSRGQVIGTVGRTGNADEQSVRPHVHFELRAPFLLDWTQLGHERVLDAFNPYHSLVAADPRRNP